MKDFSYDSVAGKDMSKQDLVEADFFHTDCTGTNLAGSNLYRANFVGARLKDTIISLSCATFSKVKLDANQVEYMIYLLMLADIPDNQREVLTNIISQDRIAILNKLFGQK